MVILPIFMFLVGFPYDRYYSRIKERGQASFLPLSIIPQQRANEGEWWVFFSEKFGKASIDGWGHCWMLGPFQEPTDFETKMGKTAVWQKAILLREKLYS